MRLCATREQIEIIQHPARRKSLFAGRRWGKTYLAVLYVLSEALKNPSYSILFVAPTYSQTETVFSLIRNHSIIRKRILRDVHKPHPSIEFVNGSKINFRSLHNPDSIRGGKYNLVIIDESQDCLETIYQAVLSPLVADSFGSIVILGQFRGHDWRYESFYKYGIDPNNDEYMTWVYPTSSGLMFQSEKGRAQLERDRRSMPKIIHDQEYDCIPTAKVNAVYRYDDLQRSKRGSGISRGLPNKKYIIAVDVGQIVDPSALVVLDIETKTVVYTEAFPLRLPYENQVEKVRYIQSLYNNGLVVYDATGGGGRPNRTDNDGINKIFRDSITNSRPFIWHYNNKGNHVNNLSIALEQGKISIPPEHKALHDQLSKYEYHYKASSNLYTYNAPQGEHDDLALALMMGWAALIGGWGLGSSGGVALSSLR